MTRLAARERSAPTPTGEHLVGAFSRLFGETGHMAVHQVSVGEIGAHLLPCVLILRDGTGMALLGRDPDGRFRAATASGAQAFSEEQLQAWGSGRVVTLAGRSTRASSRVAEPAEENGSVVREIGRATLASRLLPQLIVAAALSNVFVFVLPVYSMIIYDRIVPHRAIETLWALTGGIAIVFMVDLFCRSMRNKIQEAIGIDTSLRLQQTLYGRLIEAELAHAQRKSGVLSSGLGALDAACLIAPVIFTGAAVDLPFTLLILIYVATLAHWVVIAPTICIMAIVAISVASHIAGRRAHVAGARHIVQRSSLIEEGARTLEVTKAIGGERHALERWARLIDTVSYHSHVGRNAGAWAGQAVAITMQAGTVLALVIGVFLINSGDMTVGALSAAVLLTSRTVGPVSALASSIVRALSLAETLNHVHALRQVPREEAGDVARRPDTIEGRIRLSQVSFKYPKEAKPALSDITFAIEPGERVGIIGRIGSGKSTLVHLVPRLYSPDNGNVLIDDHDVRQYDPSWLRRRIAFMPQDCDLLEATLRENIVRGLDEVDESAFQRAVHASGVKDFAARHPAGYGMTVGPTGRRLSGGERQAVCLARTLVRDAPVLVLDEPTSSMDSQLELQVVERLRPMITDRTVIIATHRAPLLALVTRIIWLDNGRIIADGPSAEVMRQASRMSA